MYYTGCMIKKIVGIGTHVISTEKKNVLEIKSYCIDLMLHVGADM